MTFLIWNERAEILKEYKAALEAQQIAHREPDGISTTFCTQQPTQMVARIFWIPTLECIKPLKINSVCEKMSNADCAVKSLEGALVRGTRSKLN